MSVTVGQNSSPTVTTTYTAHSYRYDSDDDNDDAYSNTGYTSSTLWRPTVAIQKNNNFVEIIPAGIQVVSGTGRYSRLSRRDQNSSDVELLEVIDGSVKIQSRNSVSSGTSAGDKVGIEVDGDIVPETNTTWDIGKSSKYWENGYFVNLNGGYFDSNIRTMVAGGKFIQYTNNSNPSTSNTFNIASITRVSEGAYAVTLSNTTTFSMSNAYAVVGGYGRSGDNDSQNSGDNEFTCNWGVKVSSTNILINSKDNNGDTDFDFEVCYLQVYSR
jgi:hypothetical protein